LPITQFRACVFWIAEAGLETPLGGKWLLTKVIFPAQCMLTWTVTLPPNPTNTADTHCPRLKHGLLKYKRGVLKTKTKLLFTTTLAAVLQAAPGG
jgi:hypothetical protein